MSVQCALLRALLSCAGRCGGASDHHSVHVHVPTRLLARREGREQKENEDTVETITRFLIHSNFIHTGITICTSRGFGAPPASAAHCFSGTFTEMHSRSESGRFVF
jgi:hypothetical protein